MNNPIIQKLDLFFEPLPQQTWKKHALLIPAGTIPDHVIYVKKGYIRQYAITKSGKEMTAVIYREHAFFPMVFALTNLPNRYYFESLTEGEGRVASFIEFLPFLKKNPDVILHFTGRLYRGLETILLHSENIAHADATTRLTSALLSLAQRFGVVKNQMMIINLKRTHLDLASETGLSRETVSRIMEKLEADNVLSYTNHLITLHNLDLLQLKSPLQL